MKNLLKLFGIIALVAIIGFSFVTCDNGGDDDGDGNGGGGSNGKWRTSKYKHYTVTDGVASLALESVHNYITYRYTSDTNYEIKYTSNLTSYYGETPTTSSSTDHITRNGQTHIQTREVTTETYTQTATYTTTYDSATGLTLTSNQTSTLTDNSGTTTTSTSETTYNIELISDSGGIKTYKVTTKTSIYNGTSQDLSNQGYTEYKIQNGKILGGNYYTADGVQSSSSAICYIYPDNAVSPNDKAVISAKLGDRYFLAFSGYPVGTVGTVEVLSDSATELSIRWKGIHNNVLVYQIDYTYEKVN